MTVNRSGARPRDEDLASAFGRNLARVRSERGFSQEALAKAAGFSRDTIVKMEGGRRAPRLDTLLIICDVLKVEPNELLAGLKADYEPKWRTSPLPST